MTALISTIMVISLLHFSTATWSESFEETLKSQHYDEKLPPPNENGNPVTVTNQIQIFQLSDFRTDLFTYNFEYVLRLWWKDVRLANVSHEETTETDDYEGDHFTYNRDVDIWLPRLSVINSGADQTVEDGRVAVHIDRNNGDVYRSVRRKSR